MKYFIGLFVLAFSMASCSSTKRVSGRWAEAKPQSQLIKTAHSYIGKPYKFGGAGPKAFDCSGFTSFVYNKSGVIIPRTTSEQAKFGQRISLGTLRTGDLIFFSKGNSGRKINHVALVENVAPGIIQVIHSTSSKGVISENILKSNYWKERILFYRRIR